MPTRVLIADNDLEMLKLLRQHLEAEGCQVVAAAGGAAAIAALGAEERRALASALAALERTASLRSGP